MQIFQEVKVCSDPFTELRETTMKVNLSNEQCSPGVQAHAISWTNEHQTTDTWRTVELFDWFILQIAMTTV